MTKRKHRCVGRKSSIVEMSHDEQELRLKAGLGRHRRKADEIVDWDTVDFCTKSDSQIAKETGAHKVTVYKQRRARGIKCMIHNKTMAEWEAEFGHLFSVMSDRELGELTGRGRQAIAHMRKKLGKKTNSEYKREQDAPKKT